MAVLLGAGAGLLVAGLAAIGYGIPIKEFSFGSTMILSGVVAACSGAILLALWMVARQLQTIALGFGAGVSLAPRSAPELAAALGQPGDSLFSRDQPSMEKNGAVSGPPPWQSETASQGGGPAEAPPVPQALETAPTPRPKRNLLFSSTSRRERERAAARTSEPLAPDLLSPELRPPPSAPSPVTDPAGSTPPSFDDAWPKPERGRAGGEAPSPLPARRSVRAPSTLAEGNAESGAPGSEAPPQPQVTVLKSGVVDGMAYSLYSDGSIEAQMPEGMMRFASIDELRAHLDQRP